MESSITKYRALVEAVRQGSLTRAARTLSYSQSGISRMIADLERDWGVTLLERGRAGVRLTADGESLMPLVERVCDDQRRLAARLDELRGLAGGSVRVGTFSSVATHWLPPVLASFRRDYPDVEHELLMGDYSEIESWVADGRVDLGFIPRRPRDRTLEWHPLGTDELRAVVPREHPLAARDAITPAQLCDEPFILLERGDDDEVTPIFEHAGARPRTYFSTWDDYAIMSMVECGVGLSVLPALILRKNAYEIASRPLDPPAYRTIGVVTRAQGGLSLAARTFLGYLEVGRFDEPAADQAEPDAGQLD